MAGGCSRAATGNIVSGIGQAGLFSVQLFFVFFEKIPAQNQVMSGQPYPNTTARQEIRAEPAAAAMPAWGQSPANSSTQGTPLRPTGATIPNSAR
jgi:hypothetical protein